MWFERWMGFAETDPEQVRDRLQLNGRVIRSRVNGQEVGCGWLELPRLDALRRQDPDGPVDPSTVQEVVGDVVGLHRDPAHAGALFQAASQFNLLEMASPTITPEQGVGMYSHDRTQGPACAIACGGGTIYRNYFARVDGQPGQTSTRQIDALADLADELGRAHWRMQNGYAFASAEGLRQMGARLHAAESAELERLRGLLCVGVQHQVQVLGTDHTVTQVYGSALPVAYGEPAAPLWEPVARLVLEASYEATLRIARQRGCRPVFLTYLGGGVFGNDDAWITDAIVRAVRRVGGLDVRLVSYGRPHRIAAQVQQRLARAAEPGAQG